MAGVLPGNAGSQAAPARGHEAVTNHAVPRRRTAPSSTNEASADVSASRAQAAASGSARSR
jgi:hypothetical protein